MRVAPKFDFSSSPVGDPAASAPVAVAPLALALLAHVGRVPYEVVISLPRLFLNQSVFIEHLFKIRQLCL